MQRVIRVLPDVTGLDRVFDYVVPPDLDGSIEVGTVVRVPLHGRRVRGWVVADGVEPPAGVRLLRVAAVLGRGPAPDVVALAAWAAHRWAGPVRPVLVSASPPRLVPVLPAPVPHRPAGAAGPEDDLWEAALARRRSLVRLPPATPRWPAVEAAVRRLTGTGSVLVCCAEQADADRVSGRLRAAGVPVAAGPDAWALAAAGGRVVVGARAAAWAPLPGLAAALVLDAHEESLKEERVPAWRAWEVLAERCGRSHSPLLTTSPCPGLDLLEWGDLVTVPRAVERDGWAVMEVVDRRGDDPRSGLFSTRLVDLVRGAGDPGRPVLCVLNRRGRARLLVCRACGELARCEDCGAALGTVRDRDGLVCPRCGATRPTVCAHCGAGRLAVARPGVSRVAEELAALTGRAVPEVSSDRDEGWEDAPVVMGTEAILHRARRAAAVAFLEMDQELLAPRYRAGEQALALLARASRLTGGRQGRVLVQTRVPDHPVLTAAVRADPGLLAAEESSTRRALGLPPYAALAALSGAEAGALASRLQHAGLQVAETGGTWLVRAPFPDELANALATARHPDERVRVEVDPVRV